MADDATGDDESATTPERTPTSGAALATAWSISVGTVLAGRYEVRRLLGRGGMGIVVQALDRVLGENVALKLLRPELASERRWVERLAREVKLARQIQHPNVCRVFDFVQDRGQAFVVMELALRTLRDERRLLGSSSQRAPDDRTMECRFDDVRSIVRGVAAIHAGGVIHRDITLANVLRLADGRLVVSDFGLAMGADDPAASLHGGTFAYMAPELTLGGKASYASDVWALGVVIHEVMFGDRPSWRPNTNDPTLEELGRHLSAPERMVLDTCRACLSRTERGRPPDAPAVATLLSRARQDRWRRRPVRAALGAMALFVLLICALVLQRAMKSTQSSNESRAAAPGDAQRPIPWSGVAADWTDTSKVLLTVHGRIHCIVPLPDHRTIRLVWGNPRHAEDVDVVTGRRIPSPIVPESYAAGCPDLSPDGRSLIFQGYDDESRPVVLSSASPDGSHARPFAPSANLTNVSEPRWLADGTLVFSPDEGHAAVADVASNRLTILPAVDARSSTFVGWRIDGRELMISAAGSDSLIHAQVLSWPDLSIRREVVFAGFDVMADCMLAGPFVYCTNIQERVLLRIDLERSSGSRLGSIRGQEVMLLATSNAGLVFTSRRLLSDAWFVESDGVRRPLTRDGVTIDVADCGEKGFLMAKIAGSDEQVTRVSRDGKQTVLTAGNLDFGVECSKKSDDWWFSRAGVGDRGIYHCRGQRCGRIVEGFGGRPALSPDGTRLAFFAEGGQGLSVKWTPSAGGEIHDVGISEGGCAPGWSSSSTIWISRRIRGRPVWTEVEADTGRATGRTAPSANDCQEGHPDPLSPVRPEIRIVMDRISQLRVQSL